MVLLASGAAIAARSYLQVATDHGGAVMGVALTLLSNAVSATVGVLVKRLGKADDEAPVLLSSRVASQLRLTARHNGVSHLISRDDTHSKRPSAMPPRLVTPSERRHRRSYSADTPIERRFALPATAGAQNRPEQTPETCREPESKSAGKAARRTLTIMMASSCVTGPAAVLAALVMGELAQAAQLEWTPRLVGTLFLSSACGVCVMLGIYLTTQTYEPIVTAVAGNVKDIPLALMDVSAIRQSAGTMVGTAVNFSGSLLYVLVHSGLLDGPDNEPSRLALDVIDSTDDDDDDVTEEAKEEEKGDSLLDDARLAVRCRGVQGADSAI